MAQQLLTRDLEIALNTGDQPAVLDFYADWCVPCRMQGPQFQQAENELKGYARFYKVNIEQQPEMAARFDIMSIPTIVVVKNGSPCWRNVGVTSKEEIVSAVRQAVG